MGSRRGGSFQEFAGTTIADKIRKVSETIRTNRPARIVVNTAIDALAASNPVTGTLVATFKLAKSVRPIVLRTWETYRETGNPREALKTLAVETTRFAISETRDQVIGNYVDISWKQIKDSAKIGTDELADRILTSGAKNVLSEVLPHE